MFDVNQKFMKLIDDAQVYLGSRSLNSRERNHYLRALVDSMVSVMVADEAPIESIEFFKSNLQAIIPDDPSLNTFIPTFLTIPQLTENLAILKEMRLRVSTYESADSHLRRAG